MRDGGEDFRTGETIGDQTYFDDRIDIYHIFPQKWCVTNKIERNLYDSVSNKTAISAKTNRIISAKAPSVYHADLERVAKVAEERMDSIFRCHVIDPLALRCDDFDEFFKDRQSALVARIEAVMGKKLILVEDEGGIEDVGLDQDDGEYSEAAA